MKVFKKEGEEKGCLFEISTSEQVEELAVLHLSVIVFVEVLEKIIEFCLG